MPNELYIYMVIMYFAIAFARSKCEIKISLFGAFVVATLTKLNSIGTLAFFHTVLYEVIMFAISYLVLALTYNYTKMSKLGYLVEILVAILLVYVYYNLGTYIFNI